MIRALVVDDEVHARESLREALRATGQVEVVGTCANAIEALHAIRALAPDVVFLDVRMPQVSGFELLSMVEEEAMPRVVFVTAHDEFAVKAFEENALDYLLKPVQRERLARTVEKLQKALREGERQVFGGPRLERIPCAAGKSIRLVPVAEVELVRSSEAGVYVVTAAGEFFTELTLQVLEAKTDLVRCHRQVLVNVARVEQILRPEPRGAVLRTRSGKEVPVSRRYFVKLKERLGLRL